MKIKWCLSPAAIPVSEGAAAIESAKEGVVIAGLPGADYQLTMNELTAFGGSWHFGSDDSLAPVYQICGLS